MVVTHRLRIVEILANFYRSVIIQMPKDLVYCVYMCSNRVRGGASAVPGARLIDADRSWVRRTRALSWALANPS